MTDRFRHSVCPKDIRCDAWEHKLWKALISGKMNILADPTIENPETAFSPQIISSTNEITKILLDMRWGVSIYIFVSKISDHMYDFLRC